MSLFNSKKLKDLQSENEDDKENRLKNFEELLKSARLEYSQISIKKDHTAQKLESLEKEKSNLLGDLSKISYEIKQLREMKLSEQNQIISLGKAFDETSAEGSTNSEIIDREIDAVEKRKNDIALETFKLRKELEKTSQKIKDGNKVINNLNAEIEKKKEEISSLIERQMLVSDDQYKNFNLSYGNKSIDDIHLKIDKLIRQEKELTEMVNSRKQLLTELDKRIGEKKVLIKNESKIHKSIGLPPQSESLKNENILELEIKSEAIEAQIAQLTNEFKAKTELFNELQEDNKQVADELQKRKIELVSLNDSIETSTDRLTDLDYSLNILDNEFEKISKEISDRMTLKENLDAEIVDKTNQKLELEDVLKELKETTTILARLKNDIEKGSGESAKRFTGVLQYYSTMINDIYKKKKDAEKVLNKKEKELHDKERSIKEIENALVIRHSKIKLFEDLTREITNQRKMIEARSLSGSELNETDMLIIKKDIAQKKLLEYENVLTELINASDKFSGHLIGSKISLEKEISENKKRLNEFNQNIRQSTGELSELKNSITKIKIEHEEHRVSINKLTSIKTRLEDHIDKHKQVIEKYINIKEKIRQEQELIKKKREITSSEKSSVQDKVVEKSFEPHNPKWMKL